MHFTDANHKTKFLLSLCKQKIIEEWLHGVAIPIASDEYQQPFARHIRYTHTRTNVSVTQAFADIRK